MALNRDELTKALHDERWFDAANMIAGLPLTTEPRRTVGAVVQCIKGGSLWLVVNSGTNNCQRLLSSPQDLVLVPAYNSDQFVRWATCRECEQHGIPYVKRGPNGGPSLEQGTPMEEALRTSPAPANPANESRFIHVEGRGVLVDGVVGSIRLGEEVLIRARVRGIEGSDVTSVKTILLYSACRVTAPESDPMSTTEACRTVGAVLRGKWCNPEFIVIGPKQCRRIEEGIDGAVTSVFRTDTFVRWATHEECERHGLKWIDRMTPYYSDPPASKPEDRGVDREGLAKALRKAENGTEYCESHPWDKLSAVLKDRHLKNADAVIEYMKDGA